MNIESQIKAIRNKFRDYRLDDLIIQITIHIRKNEINTNSLTTPGTPQQWLLFLMLKFSILYAGQNNAQKKANEADFRKLYNMLHELNGVYQRILLDQDGYPTLLTSLAHTQFYYQLNFTKSDLARIKFLFYDLENTKIDFAFRSKFNLGITTYIKMLLFIWFHIYRHPDLLIIDYKNYLTECMFTTVEIENFISIVSKDTLFIKNEHITAKGNVTNALLQPGEFTPFYNFPILKTSGTEGIIYSRRILEKHLGHFLFEFIKSEPDDSVISFFSSKFEKYARSLLTSAGASFISENELGNLYESKRTDFLIVEDKTNIMIEIKSVRLPSYCKANPSKEIILRALEDNVIKAITQGFELSDKIYCRDHISDFFLLIVTYDDMYLGKPQTAWDYFFKEYFNEQLKEQCLPSWHLNPEKIFIISIDEFEILCNYRYLNNNFSSILNRAVLENKNPSTAKFNISLLFDDINEWKLLPIMERHLDDLCDIIHNQIQE